MFCSYSYQICNDNTSCPAKQARGGGTDWKGFEKKHEVAQGCKFSGKRVTEREYQFGIMDDKTLNPHKYDNQGRRR